MNVGMEDFKYIHNITVPGRGIFIGFVRIGWKILLPITLSYECQFLYTAFPTIQLDYK